MEGFGGKAGYGETIGGRLRSSPGMNLENLNVGETEPTNNVRHPKSITNEENCTEKKGKHHEKREPTKKRSFKAGYEGRSDDPSKAIARTRIRKRYGKAEQGRTREPGERAKYPTERNHRGTRQEYGELERISYSKRRGKASRSRPCSGDQQDSIKKGKTNLLGKDDHHT